MMRAFLPCLLLSLGASGAALAAGDEPAMLRHFNRDVAMLRAPLLGLPPAQRAEAAAERLRQTLSQTQGLEVSVVPVDLGRAIELNGRLVFFVLPGDLDPEEGLTLDQAADRAAASLREALEAGRSQHETATLTRGLAVVAAATLVSALLAIVLLVVRRRVLGVVERFLGSRRTALTVRGVSLLRWQTLAAVVATLVRVAVGLLLLALSVQWLALSLVQFPYSRPWGDRLQGFIWGLVERITLGIISAVPDLAVVLVIGWLTFWATRLARVVFRQVEEGRWLTSWLTPDTAVITRKLVSLALVLFGLVMAYPYLPGSDTEAFKGLSVLVGVMVSLGGSSTIGQAAAGLILIYTRSFSVGDQVRIGDAAGQVVAMGMFTTRLRTSQGEELVVPNAAVLAATTRNYTRPGTALVVETKVTIGYDTSWRQVESLLLEGATRTAGLRQEPAPRVLVVSLDDFYVTYQLVVAAPASSVREQVLAELGRNVLDAFNDAKVQIMSPHYRGDPASPKLAEGRPVP